MRISAVPLRVVIAALVAAAAALLAACGGGGGSQPVAATQQLTSMQQLTATQPTLPQSAPPVSTTPPPATAPTRATAPPSVSAGEAQFWQLIAETRQEAGGNTGDQSSLLQERLTKLPAEQIAAFGQIRHALDQQAYTWDLWGAAYVIEDGCSDDCFRDFRAYLISLGQGPYEAALRDPDSLAPVVQDAETGDWENADNVAPEAYQDVTGEDIPVGDSDLSGRPRGVEWDDSQQEALIRRYPRLAARFR
jgi:hypothetical protein